MITPTRLRSSRIALCVAALAACNPSLGDATDATGPGETTGGATGPGETGDAPTDATGPGETGDASTGASEGDAPTGTTGPAGGGQPCSGPETCPEGQECFNGECALACDGDGDCAGDQYCGDDGLCHDRLVGSCPATPCADGQICFEGLCSTPPGGTCRFDPAGQDGCAVNALCYEDPDPDGAAKCYTLPYCGEDDTCPIGTAGAVCNVDLVPNKQKVCMIGACTDVAHCPTDWRCVKLQNQVIGFCSSGAPGFPCAADADCLSGACEGFPGFPGLCL